MGARESIRERIDELKQKIANDTEIINHHKQCIEDFSKAVTEHRDEIKELNGLMNWMGGVEAPSVSNIKSDS